MDLKNKNAWNTCECCNDFPTRGRRGFLGAALGGAIAATIGIQSPPASAQSAGAANRAAPSSGNYILRGGYVVTMDPAIADLPIGDVHVSDGKILAVGRSLQEPGAESVDAKGMIVMPGFVETHSHLWNALFKNMRRPGVSYFPLKATFAKLHTPTDYYRANRLFLTDAIDTGITTVLNYAHNTQTPDHVDEEVRAMVESGLRGRYAYSGIDEYPGDKLIDFDDIRRVRDKWFGASSNGLVDLGYGLRPAFPLGTGVSVYPQEFRWAEEQGIPIILHAGLTPTAVTPTPTKLYDQGFRKNLVFVHNPWYTQSDRDLMAQNGWSGSFSLGSEMANQVGPELRMQVLDMVRLGVNVCLSHDATSLSPTSMFEQMRLALNMAPVPNTAVDKTRLTQTQVLEMATINGAKALGIANKTGSLTPGKRADLILLRGTDINMVPFEDARSAVVHSATTKNVDTVIVDGRVLKFDGRILSVDVDDVRRQANASFYALREKAGGVWAPKPWEVRSS